MQQIPVEEIFAEAEDQVTDEARDDDGPHATRYLLFPGRWEDVPHKHEDRGELRGKEEREEYWGRRIRRSTFI